VLALLWSTLATNPRTKLVCLASKFAAVCGCVPGQDSDWFFLDFRSSCPKLLNSRWSPSKLTSTWRLLPAIWRVTRLTTCPRLFSGINKRTRWIAWHLSK
jgi:hypothetical protein